MKNINTNKLLVAAFIGASLVCFTAGVSAATVSEITSTIHWGTLSVTGQLVNYTSATLPAIGTVSVSKDASVNLNGGVDTLVQSNDNLPLVVSDTVAGILTADAGIDNGSSDVYFHALATNNALGAIEAANGYAFKESYFTPITTGQVTFTVDYSISLGVGTDAVSYPDISYSGAGYEMLFSLGSVDAWLSAYDGTLAGEAAADAAAFITDNFLFDNSTYTSFSGCVSGSFGCGLGSLSEAGTLTVTASLNAGETYWINGEARGWVYTDTVSAVPVPAAVWLFGSGLIGLIGVAKRKKP